MNKFYILNAGSFSPIMAKNSEEAKRIAFEEGAKTFVAVQSDRIVAHWEFPEEGSWKMISSNGFTEVLL